MYSLKIVQHNILNWRTNKDSVMYNFSQINPDIILINSHGLKDSESLKIPGYKTYKVNSSGEINDGSAIAIKQHLHHKLFDDFLTDFIAVQIETSLGPIIIATTYLPPRRPYLPFPDMHTLLSNTTPTYIIGDFNATHRCFGNNSSNTVGKSLAALIDQGHLQHLGPHFPTFIRQNTATSPDKIFSNKHHFLNTYMQPGNITSSDHLPIILTLSTKPIYIEQEARINTKHADWEAFRTTINESTHPINVNNITTDEIEDHLHSLILNIKNAMNTCIPTHTHKKIFQLKTNNTIRQLEQQYVTLSTTASIQGWTLPNFRKYTQLRQQLKTECKEASRVAWENKITNIIESTKDTKSFWQKINRLRGKDIITCNYLTDEQGNKYHTDKEKCRVMEQTWKNIFTITPEENATFDTAHSDHITAYINTQHDRITPHDNVDLSRLNNNFYDREISTEEITRHIRRMKNKAPGSTNITKEILEKCPPAAINNLRDIFNACLATGYFPNQFKEATIKFIPKANKPPKNPLNYRPISLLEVPGKLLEKIILSRLDSYLTENSTINNRQHGFRPKRGTQTAITTAYELASQALAQKHQCYIILRDVAKAFDKVWHTGLKYKILQLGLPNTMEKILSTFLDNRTAKIKIGKDTSNNINLKSGVPQGSVLSPSLYTLYTNDMPVAGPGCHDIMYADDITQIITSPSKSKSMMKLKVEREIKRINNFEYKWKIKTSENKFKIIPLAQYKIKDIIINGNVMQKSNEGTMLGLKLQNTGITGHITSKINKTTAALTKLYRFTNLTPKIKTTLVKTLLLPILEYPPIPLVCASKSQQLKMQRVLNKTLRFVFRNDNRLLTTEQMHELTGIKPINISLHNKATKIWETVRFTDEAIYNTLTTNITPSHYWFPSSLSTINSPTPDPIYT